MDKIDSILNKMIDLSLDKPELVPKRVLIIRLTRQTLEKIFTSGRMNLIRAIKKEKPESVGELAKLVKRPVESVSRDLRILENFGILSFVRTGKKKTPGIEKDILMIPLTV